MYLSLELYSSGHARFSSLLDADASKISGAKVNTEHKLNKYIGCCDRTPGKNLTKIIGWCDLKCLPLMSVGGVGGRNLYLLNKYSAVIAERWQRDVTNVSVGCIEC